MMISESDVKNGQVWENALGLKVVVQYLWDNQFMLLAVPINTRHGGTCMIVMSDPEGTGKLNYTRDELAERLKKYKWRLRPDLRITLKEKV